MTVAHDQFDDIFGGGRGRKFAHVEPADVPDRLWPQAWPAPPALFARGGAALEWCRDRRGPGVTALLGTIAEAMAGAVAKNTNVEWMTSLHGALGLLDTMNVAQALGEGDDIWHLLPQGHLHPPALQYEPSPAWPATAVCGLTQNLHAEDNDGWVFSAPGEWAEARAGTHPAGLRCCPACATAAADYSDTQVQPRTPEAPPVQATETLTGMLREQAPVLLERVVGDEGTDNGERTLAVLRGHLVASHRAMTMEMMATRMVELKAHATLGLMNRSRDPGRHPELAQMRRAVSDDSLFDATVTHSDWLQMFNAELADPFDPVAFTNAVHTRVLDILGDRV